MIELLGEWLQILLFAMATALALAVLGLIMIAKSIRQLNVPHDADFFTTLRYVPLALMIILDLLDFGLDILAAPVSWLVLDRLGLYGLRNKAALEALIPFTQPIPTFTIGWLVARILDLGDPPGVRRQVIEGDYVVYEQRPRRRLPRYEDD
jgi:hypothetical protein